VSRCRTFLYRRTGAPAHRICQNVSRMWRDLYLSQLQSLWALEIVPLAYLAWRAFGPARDHRSAADVRWRFVDRYAIAFALQTLIDPLATGPLVTALGIADTPAATAVMVCFVLLGDFRVYLLVFALLALASGRAWRTALPSAAMWTLLVPAIALPANAALRAMAPGLDANSIWLVYELTFAIVALALRVRVTAAAPAALRGYLRDVLAYVALYYALWASSDVLIQLAGLDLGWLLRLVPNQLYYSFWIPFVVWRFRVHAAR